MLCGVVLYFVVLFYVKFLIKCRSKHQIITIRNTKQHTTTQHNITQHNTTQHSTQHNTQHSIAQYNTT